MDRIRWIEKSITFRNLVDNPAIQKPALVQIGSKSIVVGEKINGEFIAASPCKATNNRYTAMEQDLVLSSKHNGIWKVISKSEGHIHRLTTKDIERIYRQDVKNERATPRSYMCTKDIEAFELRFHQNDSTIVNGQRLDRQKKYIEENVEFEITDAGEVECTPTEGERTSQDYVIVPKKKPGTFLQLLIPGIQDTEQLVRNRTLRTLYCTTKNEPHKRRFLLDVNEQPCDIRPIASEGSTELRYLHSTQNLFDYMLNYGNNTFLYVKLLRGDPPIKAVDFDGYLVLKSILNGDRIPMCGIEDLAVSLAYPDLSVRVKLPSGNPTWRALPEFRTAEVQCMQLSLALLARHESEMYVTIETEKKTSNYLQSIYNQEKRSVNRPTRTFVRKQSHEDEQTYDKLDLLVKPAHSTRSGQAKMIKAVSMDENKTTKQPTSRISKSSSASHSVSDKLHRDDVKRALPTHSKGEQQRPEPGEKHNQNQRPIPRDK